VPEGVLLGQQHGKMYVARTFITYDMTTGMQRAEFEDKRSKIITDRDLYDHARAIYY
jgi:hypothetical protein